MRITTVCLNIHCKATHTHRYNSVCPGHIENRNLVKLLTQPQASWCVICVSAAASRQLRCSHSVWSFYFRFHAFMCVRVCVCGGGGGLQQREVVKLLFPSSPYLQSLLYLSSISVLSPDSIYVLYLLHLILSARHREMQSKRERERIR